VDEKGRLKEEVLAALVEHLIEKGVHGLTPLGSTGEGAYLDWSSKQRVIRVVVEASAGASVAIALPDHDAADRGSVIYDATEALPAVSRVRARCLWLGPQGLRPGANLELRCETQMAGVRVEAIAGRIDPATAELETAPIDVLHFGDLAEFQLRLGRPLLLEPSDIGTFFGRFILDQDDVFVGAGVVKEIYGG
jgi:sulfate adenylyltransferase subunit 1 (EFTu-like GTPase family)